MKKQFVRRLPPVDLYDVGGMEGWLSEMAGKGLLLEDIGTAFVRFRRETPERRRYRMEPTHKGAGVLPDERQYTAYADAGWRYDANLAGMFYIYSAPDDAVIPELHSDPVTQGVAYALLDRRLLIAAVAAVLPLVWIAASLIWLFSFRMFLLDSASFTLFLQALLFGLLAWYQTRCFWTVRRLRRRLLAGEGIDRTPRRKRSGRAGLVLLGVSLAAVGFQLCTNAYAMAVRSEAAIADPVPALRLAAVERDPAFEIPPYYKAGVDRDNRVRREWSPLTPVQLEIEEHGRVPDKQWPDGSDEYSPSIHTTYYRVRFAPLAEPLFASLLRDEWRFYEPDSTREELTGTPFTRAVLLRSRSGGGQYLYAYRGSSVLSIRYYGTRDLKELMDELAACVQAYEEGTQ